MYYSKALISDYQQKTFEMWQDFKYLLFIFSGRKQNHYKLQQP